MVNPAPKKPGQKRSPIPRRATGLVQLRLAKDDHAALMAEAKRVGLPLTTWMRDAAQEALASEEEKRFSTRLRIVEAAADRAAKGTLNLEKRMGDLYALGQSIERKTIERDQEGAKAIMDRMAAIEAQTAALVASAEVSGTHLSTALILLGCLLRGGTPESRKAYREVVSRGLSVGQILQAIAKGAD